MAEENRTQQQRKLEQMSKEALEAIIHEDCVTPGIYEEAYIDAVLEELVCRGKQEGKTLTEEELDQVWERIQVNFNRKRDDENVRNILEWVEAGEKQRMQKTATWKRIGAIAAILAMLILLVPTASGEESIFQIIANWAENVFTISSSGRFPAVTEPSDGILYDDNNEGLTQLREVLRGYGVTELVVPTWIPDGFELSEIDVDKLDDGTYIVHGTFKCKEKSLTFYFMIRSTDSNLYGERDNDTSTKYMSAGLTHYIVSNNLETQCVWINGRVRCRFNGDISEIEAHTMINSIYTVLEGN